MPEKDPEINEGEKLSSDIMGYVNYFSWKVADVPPNANMAVVDELYGVFCDESLKLHLLTATRDKNKSHKACRNDDKGTREENTLITWRKLCQKRLLVLIGSS
jgi:hypothetical protein